METFLDRLLFLVKQCAGGKHTLFAKKAGIPKGSFQRYVDGSGVPKAEHLVNISNAYSVSLDWLLTGRGTPFIIEERVSPANGNVTDIDQAHCDIVARFKNKSAAREANMDLLKLERVSPAKFEKALGYIKGLADGLEEPADQVDKKNHA